MVKRVTVVLVTGNRLEVVCDPASTRVSHVLQVSAEDYFRSTSM